MDLRPARHADPSLGDFARRVLVVLLLGALALAAWQLTDLGVLLFAAVLMAIGLQSSAKRLSRAARIGETGALAAVVALFLLALGAALWFFGTVIGAQF